MMTTSRLTYRDGAHQLEHIQHYLSDYYIPYFLELRGRRKNHNRKGYSRGRNYEVTNRQIPVHLDPAIAVCTRV